MVIASEPLSFRAPACTLFELSEVFSRAFSLFGAASRSPPRACSQNCSCAGGGGQGLSPFCDRSPVQKGPRPPALPRPGGARWVACQTPRAVTVSRLSFSDHAVGRELQLVSQRPFEHVSSAWPGTRSGAFRRSCWARALVARRACVDVRLPPGTAILRSSSPTVGQRKVSW